LAARAWVVGIVGLFAVWIVFTFLSGTIGTLWGVYNVLNKTGLIDPGWDKQAQNIKQLFLGTWAWLPFLVFAMFIVYIILESLRRRPEEYYI